MTTTPADTTNESSVTQEWDALLEAFLWATDEANADGALAVLMDTHAGPVIKKILNDKLRPGLMLDGLRQQVVEDVRGDIVLRLLKRLRELKVEPRGKTIGDFRGYVAVAAYNACYEHLRRRYPQRWRLKNRLRYVLLHEAELALWNARKHEWLCGFVGWRGQPTKPAGFERLRELIENPSALERAGLSRRESQGLTHAETLGAVFKWAEAPVELDDLVTVIALVWGIKDQPVESSAQARNEAAESVADNSVNPQTTVEQRLSLRELWAEILQLPPRQRAALLLNLKDADERDIITLLPFTRTASIKQIAAALDIPLAEFTRLWNELPMDDAQLAARLNVTRQQVINLRKCARERLRRRMSAAAGRDK